MRKKKVLISGNSVGIGGVAKALVALINTFDLKTYDVDILLLHQEGELMSEVQKGVNWLPTPKAFDWIALRKDKVFKNILLLCPHPFYFFQYIRNIIFGLIRGRMAEARQRMWMSCIDVLPPLPICYDEAYDFSGLLRNYILRCVKADKKYTWVHSDYRVFGYNKALDEPLLAQYDMICCVSNTCKKIFDDEFPCLANKSKVVPNIIDRAYIEEKARGRGFSDSFKGVRLLDITRLDPNKGLDIAVKICRRLKDKGLFFRWYILGGDPLGYEKELRKMIKIYNVEDSFVLLGFRTNPYPFMKQCDVVVHFSRFEGRSVALDEALILGKPILVTDYPTAKDQIQTGVNGIICSFDEDKLTETIESMIYEVQGKH